jgi:hypothetical protein
VAPSSSLVKQNKKYFLDCLTTGDLIAVSLFCLGWNSGNKGEECRK